MRAYDSLSCLCSLIIWLCVLHSTSLESVENTESLSPSPVLSLVSDLSSHSIQPYWQLGYRPLHMTSPC